MNPAERRAAVLSTLGTETFDVLVIGAGIIGCRVALEAASAGMRVALVDRADIASGTSSASSKFVHGGFRYLTMRSFGLVRAAQRERAALLRGLPGLVKPMPMIVALDGRRYPRSLVALGVSAYRRLGGSSARLLGPADARELVPAFSPRFDSVLALLPEAQTDDARLTLATARAARDRGALVANYLAVEALDVTSGRLARAFVRDRIAGAEYVIGTRTVVNAAGACIDSIRRLVDPLVPPLVSLSKGVHLIYPLDDSWRAGVACYSDDDRTTFAVPWQGMLLLGTTDTAYFGRPDAARVEPEDETALLERASRLLPAELLRAERIRARFAGLRVLPAGTYDTANAPREHIVEVGPGGMVSVAGGKLTLHRLIARDALIRLPPELRPRLSRSPAFPRVTETTIEDAIEYEWAVTVEDLVRRRTNLALQGRDDVEMRAYCETQLVDAGFNSHADGREGVGLPSVMRLAGIEPATSRSGGARSIP